jgi:hypothetical protein
MTGKDPNRPKRTTGSRGRHLDIIAASSLISTPASIARPYKK